MKAGDFLDSFMPYLAAGIAALVLNHLILYLFIKDERHYLFYMIVRIILVVVGALLLNLIPFSRHLLYVALHGFVLAMFIQLPLPSRKVAGNRQ